uniref:Uncharacterized protein n=1 Tax=Arundo donax TaxID=35708 RepID=A0A0A8ZMD3_ARUDO
MLSHHKLQQTRESDLGPIYHECPK